MTTLLPLKVVCQHRKVRPMSTPARDQSATILIIDDEATVREGIRCFLEDHDYILLEAENGLEGVQILKSENPDLVLIDLTMPLMNGLETLGELKRISPHTPSIILSGTGKETDIADSLRLGAWDYLFKPIKNLSVLLHSIEKALERALLLEENRKYQHQLEVTLERRNQELKRSEEKFRSIFENLQDVYYETSMEGDLLEISPSVQWELQYTRAELLGSNIIDFYQNPNDREHLLEQIHRKGKLRDFELPLISRDGRKVTCSVTSALINDSDGVPQKICGSLRNISRRKHTEQALQESEHRFRSLVANIPVGIFRSPLGAQDTFTTANQALARIAGYDSLEELKQRRPRDLFVNGEDWDSIIQELEESDTTTAEILLQRTDGSSVWTSLTAHLAKEDGKKDYIDALLEDISQRKRAEEKLQHLAFFDELTSLPNRSLFLFHLTKSLASAERKDHFGAVLLIDLDDFKLINDSLGHQTGDKVIQEVAKRLQGVIRKEDTISRIGGDEFAILFSGLSDSMKTAGRLLMRISEKITSAMSRPISIDTHKLYLTVTIGIDIFPDGKNSAEEILMHASTAANSTRKRESSNVLFYMPEMQAAINKRLLIEKELHSALTKSQLTLFYQPQVNSEGLIKGVEALIRWQHPKRGIISPNQFIPIAENNGLIAPIGNWVISEACTQLSHWQQNGLTQNLDHISVNVSPWQFHQPNFTDSVKKILHETGIDPTKLTIELTESVIIDNLEETIKKMLELKKTGIRFSIDDFGTGYSSLSYLNRLPLDQLKIDRSFIQGLTEGSRFEPIVSTIIVMADNLGFDVVAEGVETKEELKYLIANNCHTFQGYYFARPQPRLEFKKSLMSKILTPSP